MNTARALIAATWFAGLAACVTRAPLTHDVSLIPVGLQTSSGQHLDEVLTARGQSVYECRRDGNLQLWFPEGELSTLIDIMNRSVGTVTPGGYFIAYDESSVATRRNAVSQVTAGTLVWAQLTVKGSSLRNALGRKGGHFSRTSVILRINTTGGLPPDALCEREGSALLVPFSAAYLFYSPAEALPVLPSHTSDGALGKPSHILHRE